MLINHFHPIKISKRNIEWYFSKGYECNKGELIYVKSKDLTKGSHVKVQVLCDYCLIKNKEVLIEKNFDTYIRQNINSTIKKDCCKECYPKKVAESNTMSYGVENVFQTDTIKEKSKNTSLKKYGVTSYRKTEECQQRIEATNLKKYGVKAPLQNNEIKSKMDSTVLERYGVKNAMNLDEMKEKGKATSKEKHGFESYSQTNEYKERFKKTSLNNWGTENPMQNEEIKKKVKETNIKRYGVEHVMQNKEIKERAVNSLYKNGNIPTSSQQLYVYDRLKELGFDVTLNFPLSSLSLDIALYCENFKIDIEYDGSYWHQNPLKDRKRDEFVKSQGWKVLRIKSRRLVPTDDELLSGIIKLLFSDREFTQINLSDYEDVKIS